jgi:hypothetical protein
MENGKQKEEEINTNYEKKIEEEKVFLHLEFFWIPHQ